MRFCLLLFAPNFFLQGIKNYSVKDGVPECPRWPSARSGRACRSSGNRGTCTLHSTLHREHAHTMQGRQAVSRHRPARARTKGDARTTTSGLRACQAPVWIGAQRNSGGIHRQCSPGRFWAGLHGHPLNSPRCRGCHLSSCQPRRCFGQGTHWRSSRAARQWRRRPRPRSARVRPQ